MALFDKNYFFNRASSWMEDGDIIKNTDGIYQFIHQDVVILQWSEKGGYKEYYTKEK